MRAKRGVTAGFRVGAVAVGVLAAAALLLAAAAPAGANHGRALAQSTWPGITINWFESLSDAERDRIYDTLAASGIKTVRHDATWSDIEPSKPSHGVHRYRWGRLDHALAKLTADHLTWLPVLAYSTKWDCACAGVTGLERLYHPNADPSNYAAFVGAFAQRYGRDGDFWRAHPEVAYHPITRYEIWNEEDSGFWQPRDPALYLRYLEAARAQVRAADPKGHVLMGGLTPERGRSYLEELYDLGAKPAFDELGFHPYAPTSFGVLENVRAIRKVMRRHHDTHTPVWVTEVGWSTRGSKGVSEAAQADRTAAALEYVARARKACKVQRYMAFTYYSLEDPNDPWTYAGLTHRNLSPRPAWPQFVEAARYVRDSKSGRERRLDCD